MDDHPANLLALEATLAPLGQRLVQARSGSEALRHLLEEEFACVVLDVQMPGLDGFQTAKLIKGRERSRHTPLLFLTAYHRDPADVLHGYQEGAVDYIVKPFDPDILRTKVAVFVDLHLQLERARARGTLLSDPERSVMSRETSARLRAAMEELRRESGPLPLVDAVVAAAPVGLALLDPQLRLLRINAALAAIHGTRVEAALGKNLAEVAPELAPELRRQVRRVLGTGQALQGLPTSLEVPRGSGRWHHFLCSLYPLRVGEGEAAGVGLILLDISDQRAAEQALHRSLELLADAGRRLFSSLDTQTTLQSVARLVVERLTDGCLVDLVDEGGQLKPAALAHVRLEKEALLRELQCRHGPDTFGDARRRAVAQRSSLLVEAPSDALLSRAAQDPEHLRLLRELGPHHALIVPLRLGERVLGTLSFLQRAEAAPFTTDELALLEEVASRAALAIDHARLYREAQAAIRMRDEFIAVASHELRTPLTPLQMRLQALQRQLEVLAETDLAVRGLPSAIAGMSRQVRKLAVLTDRLLDVSQASARRLHLELEPVDLREVVREVVSRSEEAAAAQDEHLELEAPEPVPGYWDRARLEQVVTNLLSNAIKYGRGRPVHVSVSAEGGQAHVVVRDEGIGIAPEDLERIFGKFERAVSERHYGGLGLGLYITHQIVDALGGCIRVQSEPGQGATFEVTLPQRLAQALESSGGHEEAAAPH
ncbi:MAG TPA: ATP-binding protein [Aggregicoccus sp.]|nr:ATP-binding protein [Aggregicoccus sp.]